MVQFHPLHLELHQEIHARPYPRVKSPSVVSHIAFFHDRKIVSDEYKCLNELAKIYQVNGVTPGTNSYFQDFDHFSLRWENHREFSTITVIRTMVNPLPLDASALDVFPNGWLDKFPGEAISASNLLISSELTEQSIESHLGKQTTVASQLDSNNATIWSDLQLNKHGFTNFYIRENDSDSEEAHPHPSRLGQILLKILEVETYRQMALLGLPVAKSIAPRASSLGQQCASILEKMTKIDKPEDESLLLVELTGIAAEVERLRASSSYRFSATIAYAELVNSRIDELAQRRVEGKDLLGEFVRRRFMPAIRTCQSVQLQLESLSKRLTRASDLLRTRVDQTIAEQNQKLLESMNRRSQLQLRLQQTVEGLSVAAISYYLISLLKIFLHGLSERVFHFNENLIVSISAPFVLISIFLIVRNMKKNYIDSD